MFTDCRENQSESIAKMDSSLPHTEFKYANLYIRFREEITLCSAPEQSWGTRNVTQKAHKMGCK